MEVSLIRDQQKVSIMKNHSGITLRPTTIGDLEHLFIFQPDKEANHLAAFT
jgi:hypothetical protein